MTTSTSFSASVETPISWMVAVVSTVIITITFGAPYVAVMALKPIAAELGVPRSVPALTNSLAYLGTGAGGIFMGWWADRVGVKWTVPIGAVMVGGGAMLASVGGVWPLLLGHGVMIGLLGNAGVFAPLTSYVSYWFDRRRGVALSLVATGQMTAGAIWPLVFQRTIDAVGWRSTLFWYGVFTIASVLPLSLLLRRDIPVPPADADRAQPQPGAAVLGLSPNLVMAILSLAVICCCVTMAMPMGHLVAFCSDMGFAPARGAEMLSLLLGSAFVGRMAWGRLSDRIGGLRTILLSSACQAVGLALYLVIDDLVGLYVLSAAFGLGFGGIVPSYVLALRELFPVSQAGWRIALLMFFSLAGMAFGGWLAGAIYDWASYYRPAFAAGVAFNLVNLLLIGGLVWRDGLRIPTIVHKLARQ
jgi:MFS family permease